MKSKFILILCLVAICLITGCDKKEFTYDQLPIDGRVIGSINGIISDAATNSRLANVLVTWVSNGGVYTVRTNNLGYYGIANLNPGYYDITFSDMEGYALGKITVEIETLADLGIDNFPTTEDFHYAINENVTLYRFNASLKGMVYASPSAELTVPAEGVIVVADFNGFSLANEEYTTVTDANGAYSFDGIPATDNVDLRTMPFSTGGFDYSVATKNNVALITGGMANAGNIFLSVAPAIPFLVQNNFEENNFPLRSGLHMTFSKAMQTDGFEISLYETVKAPAEVAYTFHWTDAIVLVVDPVAALNANTSYTLSMTGMSQDGNVYNVDLEFTTEDGLMYTYTNLEVSQGSFIDFPIDGTIEIGFNMIIDLTNNKTVVNLSHETAPGPPADRDLIASTATLSADLMTLLIDPDFDLEPDQTYYISYTMYSTIPGDFETGAITFSTSSDLVAPAQVTDFALDEAVDWTADFNTVGIDFIWNSVANAASYKIFAQDNAGNTDFKEIASIVAVDNVTSQSGIINLADFPEFDWLSDDGIQTPFANGTQLTFKVVAVNSAGMGTFSAEIVVADETGDGGTGLGAQSISADNTNGATALEVEFSTTGTEYFSTTTPASWAIANDTLGYALQSGDISFSGDVFAKTGTFTVTVPTGMDASGDTVYFFLNDGSGNVSDTMMTVLGGTDFATTADIDYDLDLIQFTWTNYPGYDDYVIYVKDNLYNTDSIMFGPDAGSPYNLDLTTEPDFDGDTAQVDQGAQTPFVNTALTFTLVPRVGGEDLEPAGQLVHADTVLPSGVGDTYIAGNANNASGDTLHYTINVSGASEFLDSTSSVAATMFSFIDGNGTTPNLPTSAVSIAWNANLMSGTIYIVVPDGENHQLDTLQVTYFDFSGNEVETPLLIELTN